MYFTIRISFWLLFLSLFGCVSPFKEKPKLPQPVNYSVVSKSAWFNKKNTTLSIDTLNNVVIIKLNIHPTQALPYPVDSKDHDTLIYTAFNFDFQQNKQPILSDYMQNQLSMRWGVDSSEKANHLRFISDTIYLQSSNDIVFEIPMHVFHNLKQGKQSISLRIWQNTFKGTGHEIRTKHNVNKYANYATKCLFDATLNFELQIPEIYKSKAIGYGLELKNDSTFSPAGMDNTIFQSSYPDIYWTLYYPTDKFYAQTAYQKSTDTYTASDTFDVYHYYMNDSLGIGVFDHDNWSRDDGIGFWNGSMDYLRREPHRRFAFGNIKWFDIKFEKAKIVN